MKSDPLKALSLWLAKAIHATGPHKATHRLKIGNKWHDVHVHKDEHEAREIYHLDGTPITRYHKREIGLYHALGHEKKLIPLKKG